MPSMDGEAAQGIATGHQSLASNASMDRKPLLPSSLSGALSLKRSYSPFGRVECRPERLVPTIGLPVPQAEPTRTFDVD